MGRIMCGKYREDSLPRGGLPGCRPSERNSLAKKNRMKRNYVLALSLLLAAGLHAQITITNTDMPVSGDTLRYSTVSLQTQINYDTTGAGITWDFSNVTAANQGLYEYKTAAQVNPAYLAFFGPGSYGQKILDSLAAGPITVYDMYDFYQNSTSAFKAVGRGLEYLSLPIPAQYSDPDEIYTFPLQYNDYDSTTYQVGFTLSTQYQIFMIGTRINRVEGWGTVITPYGSFSCLKIKSEVREKDSVVVNGNPLPAITRKTVEYKWLTNGIHCPVFEVHGTMPLNNFIVSSIRYRDNYIACLNEAPHPGFFASQTIGTVSDTITLTDTTICPVIVRKWTISPNTFNYVNSTDSLSLSPQVNFTMPGLYTVKLKSTNSEGADSLTQVDYIDIQTTTGLAENGNMQLLLFPNPSDAQVNLQLPENGLRISIYNASGAIVFSAENETSELQINTASFAAGIYFVHLVDPDTNEWIANGKLQIVH